MKIKRLPKILALHLKRFKYTEDLQRLQKLFHKVVYPYHLRLFNTTDDAEDPDRLYELYAVVVHIGGGPYHGHYVAIIKTEDRGWLLFDDEMVEPVDKSYVRNFFGDRPGLACAYVLFYQETTLEAVQKEQEKEESWHGYDDPVSTGLNSNGELQRVKSSPLVQTHEIDPMEAALGHLDHVMTSPSVSKPDTYFQTMPKIAQTTISPLTQKRSDVQSKKDKAKEEKDRKAAEKEKEKADRQRRKDLETRLREAQKKQEADLKAAMEASKQSKLEEDRRVTTENANKDKENARAAAAPASTPAPVAAATSPTPAPAPVLTTAATSPPPPPPAVSAVGGLNRFKRGSKSISSKFGSVGKGDRAAGLPTDDDNTPPLPGQSTEKDKKNRFSIRKKSFGMLS